MLRIEWSMAREGNELRIDYKVRNEGAVAVIVADSFIFNYAVHPSLVIVSDDDETNTVAFRRGNVPSHMKSYLPHPVPTAMQLAPGADMVRVGRVPLPLVAFHNIDEDVRPLRASNTHAVLEVGWIDHPEATIVRQAIAKDTFIETTAHWGSQRWVRGERLPLPS